MHRLISFVALALTMTCSLGCESTTQVFGIPAAARTPIVERPDRIEWQPATMLPSGAEIAVLEGNPQESGFFAMRLRFPADYRLPPHWHTAVERITVIEGTFHVGMGETFDERSAQTLPAGSYASVPANMRHFAYTQEMTVVQITTNGPWTIEYVNPTDDPRNLRR